MRSRGRYGRQGEFVRDGVVRVYRKMEREEAGA